MPALQLGRDRLAPLFQIDSSEGAGLVLLDGHTCHDVAVSDGSGRIVRRLLEQLSIFVILLTV